MRPRSFISGIICSEFSVQCIYVYFIGEEPDAWIPVDVSFIKEFWLPDAEILNLKEFKVQPEGISLKVRIYK
jgi:hypothetical protein